MQQDKQPELQLLCSFEAWDLFLLLEVSSFLAVVGI